VGSRSGQDHYANQCRYNPCKFTLIHLGIFDLVTSLGKFAQRNSPNTNPNRKKHMVLSPAGSQVPHFKHHRAYLMNYPVRPTRYRCLLYACSPIISQLISLIQSHETCLTTDYPPGPQSAYPTSGATPLGDEREGLFTLLH